MNNIKFRHDYAALLQPGRFYPEDENGHPLADGYEVIARRIGEELNKYIKTVKDGLAINSTTNDIQTPVYISGGSFWVVTGDDNLIRKELSSRGIRLVDGKMLAGLVYRVRKNIRDLPGPGGGY